MSVTLKEVERIATLARLSFSEAEKETLAHQMNDILNYMELLNTLDTSDVEPLSHVIELHTALRADEERPCLPRAEALRNAPVKSDTFFKVPKVLGER